MRSPDPQRVAVRWAATTPLPDSFPKTEMGLLTLDEFLKLRNPTENLADWLHTTQLTAADVAVLSVWGHQSFLPTCQVTRSGWDQLDAAGELRDVTTEDTVMSDGPWRFMSGISGPTGAHVAVFASWLRPVKP